MAVPAREETAIAFWTGPWTGRDRQGQHGAEAPSDEEGQGGADCEPRQRGEPSQQQHLRQMDREHAGPRRTQRLQRGDAVPAPGCKSNGTAGKHLDRSVKGVFRTAGALGNSGKFPVLACKEGNDLRGLGIGDGSQTNGLILLVHGY